MTKDYIAIANKYIDDVLSGEIIACKFVQKACYRQKQDLAKKKFTYKFNEEKASKICRFIELLTHVKGPLAGQNIVLEPWQIFILTTIFGWVDAKGLRRFQRVYIEVPRGNAKSTISSGVALYGLVADGEKGADVYSFATTRDQARIVFDDAKAMARGNKQLQKAFGLSVLAKSLIVVATNSKFYPMSADAGTLDGLNTHIGIIDELHAHKTREVFDVVETSIGKRDQPLMWCITTAGFILNGICMEQRRFVQKILDGVVDEPSQFGIIYTIDETDDWKTLYAAQKANPNWGISVKEKVILASLKKAITDPSAENNYKTKHLDVWCNANTSWMQMSKWYSCARDVKEEDFEGEYAIFALDLATKIDIGAFIRLYWRLEEDEKVHFYVFSSFFIPEDTVRESSNSQYNGWAKRGLLTVTPGSTTDFETIQNTIIEASQKNVVIALAYDPWNATQMAQNLENAGISTVAVQATTKNFSEPMKLLQAKVYDNTLHTTGDAVMAWMASNVVCHTDAKDNIYPRKETNANKIDGIVALIMAFTQAIGLEVETNYIISAKEQIDLSEMVF